MAFMGLPCPKNKTGMRGEGWSDCSTGKLAAWVSEVKKGAARAANVVLRCMGMGSSINGWAVALNFSGLAKRAECGHCFTRSVCVRQAEGRLVPMHVGGLALR